MVNKDKFELDFTKFYRVTIVKDDFSVEETPKMINVDTFRITR